MRCNTTLAARSSWRATATSRRRFSSLGRMNRTGPEAGEHEQFVEGFERRRAPASTNWRGRRQIGGGSAGSTRAAAWRGDICCWGGMSWRQDAPRISSRCSPRLSQGLRPTDLVPVRPIFFRLRLFTVPSWGDDRHLDVDLGSRARRRRDGDARPRHPHRRPGPGTAARCDDAALEPHHMLIEISPMGAELRQLTGRVPVRVDDEPLEAVRS